MRLTEGLLTVPYRRSGTEAAPVNQNRNSANTSVVLDITGTPAANSFSYGATIAADGTTIYTEVLGSDKRGGSGAGSSDRTEIILKANTTYAFRLLRDSTVANAIANLILLWYEHTHPS
jgi:hypothetical protein|tara:strand:+ start:1646 stop:2002 length:357 start_codon:yes stop_codon:yes gene_type:complete